MQIDLENLIEGSIHFRWREALWHPTWSVCVFPSPEQYKNIIKVAKVMDYIRTRFNKPITVTSWLRASKYNEWGTVNGTTYGVAGAKASTHCEGKAVDFKVVTIPCEAVRSELKPLLEHLNIRMEQDDGRDRVHIDIKNVLPGQNRFFKP